MVDSNIKKDIKQLLSCCNEFFDKKDSEKNSTVIASIINGLDKLNTIDLYALRSQLIKGLDSIYASKTKPRKSFVMADYKLVSGNDGQFMVIEFTDQNQDGKVIFTTNDKKAAEELIRQNMENKNAVVSADEMENVPTDDMQQDTTQISQNNDISTEENIVDDQEQQNNNIDSQQLQRIDTILQQATDLANKIERAAHEHVDLDTMKDLVVDTLTIRSAVEAIQNAGVDDANVDDMVTNLENQLPQFEEKATNLINKNAPNTEELPNENMIPDNNQNMNDMATIQNTQQSMSRPMGGQQNQEPVTSDEKLDDADSNDEDDIDIMAESEETDETPTAEDIAEVLDDDVESIEDNIDISSDLYQTLSDLSELVSDDSSTKDDISNALDDILEELDEDIDLEDEDIDLEDEDIDLEDEDIDLEDEDIDLEDEDIDLEDIKYFENRDFDRPLDSSSLLESDIWKETTLSEKGIKVDKPSLTDIIDLDEVVSNTPDDANTIDDKSELKKQGLKDVTDKILDDDVKPLDGKNPVEANVLRWKEFNSKNVLVTKEKTFKSKRAKTMFAKKLKQNNNFYTIIV